MIKKYRIQPKSPAFAGKLSKLQQQLGVLIKAKSQYVKTIFSNVPMIKGGVYINSRKCGKSSCKCATTDYRHTSHYLYKTEEGKNKIVYLKQDEIEKVKKLTKNYIKYRQARAELIKNENLIMEIINKIEKVKTISFSREGQSEKKKQRNKKK